ncbi:MAG: OmpA family protein [Gemmatimonadetes bacterium]|nr:OmpA family protein [Gemmatimonadota bacterium]
MRRLTLGALGALMGAAVSVGAQAPAGQRLTPVAQRITDEAFARDLAVFHALEQRVARTSSAAGTRKYLATRAAEYVTMARDAYERNDRTAFPEDMIVLAERDLSVVESGGEVPAGTLGSVLFPNNVRVFGEELLGKAMTLRQEADRLGAPDEIARAEATLLRAGHPILAGPACVSDADALRDAEQRLLAVERTRVNPVPVEPPMVVPDRPAPVPQPDSARLPRRACDGPERLSNVARAVHFALDKHDLAASTRRVLDATIAQLKANPAVRVRLSGHTDPRASNAYNQALSQRRVDAVSAYLAANGIAGDRILRADALGEDRLLEPIRDARDMARNRRVEIIYLLCDGSELVPDETLDDLQLEAVRRRQKEK